jgi:hypothetical protein
MANSHPCHNILRRGVGRHVDRLDTLQQDPHVVTTSVRCGTGSPEVVSGTYIYSRMTYIIS